MRRDEREQTYGHDVHSRAVCTLDSSVPDALRAMHYYGLLLSSTTNRQDALYRPPPEVSVLPPYL